jgi:heme exporter protein D
MNSPVWHLPSGAFQVLVWGAIALMVVAVIVLLVILIREVVKRDVW